MSVVLGVVLFLFQTPMPAPPSGNIEGYVLRAGTAPPIPLINARLELTGTRELVARTDGTGRFVFPNLFPGKYRLLVTKDGYIRQEYGQRAVNMPGATISVAAAQQVKDIAFSLDPAPTIAGGVRDADGNPIANVVVHALRTIYNLLGVRTLATFSSTRTDERGDYRLYWLDPGEYVIASASPPLSDSRVTYAQTFFPGFADVDSAKPIRIEANREYGGMDFRLTRQPSGRLDGYTMSNVTGRGVSARVTLAPPSDGTGAFRYEGASNTQGAFTIDGLVPGTYIISATTTSGEKLAVVSRIRVRSSDNRISLELGAGVPVRGHVTTEAGSPADLRQATVELASIDLSLPSPARGVIQADGSFLLAGVQPGTYVVSVGGLSESSYLKAARFGGADALEKPLMVSYTRDDPPSLELLLGGDGGRISGAIFDKGDRMFPGALVTLVPLEDRRHRIEQFRVATSDENGRFSIYGVPPGRYEIFAWESIEPRAYLNFDYMRFFEAFALPIDIQSGENAPTSIRLIPAQQ